MNLGFGTRTTKSDDSEDTSPNKFLNLNLMPKAGYFVADHLVLGIDLSLMALRQTDDGGWKYTESMLGAGPFVRYYVPLERVLPFFELNGSFGRAKSRYVSDSNDVENKRSVNSRSLGAELNADFEAGSRAKFFLGGSLYNYRIQGDIFGYQEDNSSTNWSLKGNANIMVTKQLKFTADFDLISATVTAQGANEMFYFANTALSYTPAKLDKWSFTLMVLDIFNSNVKGLDTRAYDSSGRQIFYQETVYTRTGPIAEIGISYSFNSNGKSGKKAESSFGNSEF